MTIYIVSTIGFSCIYGIIILGAIDILNILNINNSVVDYFTVQHHITLCSYIKYGLANSKVTTIIFLSYLTINIIGIIIGIISARETSEKMLEKDMNTVEI